MSTNVVREKPILFSGAMVRAILSGRKTQTRRVVKPQPRKDADDVFTWFGEGVPPSAPQGPLGCWEGWVERRSDPCCGEQVGCVGFLTPCPYGAPGDRLWVRETWGMYPDDDGPDPLYRATEAKATPNRWRPSIFLPRHLSRLTLEVQAVRVERVQEITHADAVAEGMTADGNDEARRLMSLSTAARDEYRDLWDAINGKRGFSWDSNPYVWVVTFRRLPAPAGG